MSERELGGGSGRVSAREEAGGQSLTNALHKVTTLYKVSSRRPRISQESKSPKVPWRDRCRAFADNKIFQTTATLFTLFALFGDDIRIMATTRDADVYFNVLTITAIAIFVVEVVTCSIGKTGYWLGFFFWLDIIATSSLPLDITWVSDELFHQTDALASDEGGSSTSSNSLRASRASRAGSRAGRVVRLIRLIRLLRIIKLYKMHLEQARKKELQVIGEMRDHDDDEEHELTDESRVGKKLTEMTTRRVIMIVLLMLLCSPLWRVDGLLTNGELRQAGPQLAVNQVSDAFLRYMEAFEVNPNSTEISHLRSIYERKLLLLIYYNNPYAPDALCTDDEGNKLSQCNSPASALNTLIWVGYRTPAAWEADYVQLTPSSDQFQWDNLYHSVQKEGFRSGPLKEFAKNRLSSPWNREYVNDLVLAIKTGLGNKW
eukprot:GEMP01039208.1.p1 GENE.GEMP01039208.1~~GEMP01039208.1.p1  ORF type:complete len:431 (-),score=61.09 GEMP01039208.1:578-1870(-)